MLFDSAGFENKLNETALCTEIYYFIWIVLMPSAERFFKYSGSSCNLFSSISLRNSVAYFTVKKTYPAYDENRVNSSTKFSIIISWASKSLSLERIIIYIKILMHSSTVKHNLSVSTVRPFQKF